MALLEPHQADPHTDWGDGIDAEDCRIADHVSDTTDRFERELDTALRNCDYPRCRGELWDIEAVRHSDGTHTLEVSLLLRCDLDTDPADLLEGLAGYIRDERRAKQ